MDNNEPTDIKRTSTGDNNTNAGESSTNSGGFSLEKGVSKQDLVASATGDSPDWIQYISPAWAKFIEATLSEQIQLRLKRKKIDEYDILDQEEETVIAFVKRVNNNPDPIKEPCAFIHTVVTNLIASWHNKNKKRRQLNIDLPEGDQLVTNNIPISNLTTTEELTVERLLGRYLKELSQKRSEEDRRKYLTLLGYKRGNQYEIIALRTLELQYGDVYQPTDDEIDDESTRLRNLFHYWKNNTFRTYLEGFGIHLPEKKKQKTKLKK